MDKPTYYHVWFATKNRKWLLGEQRRRRRRPHNRSPEAIRHLDTTIREFREVKRRLPWSVCCATVIY